MMVLCFFHFTFVGCLVKEPRQRLSGRRCLDHPWIKVGSTNWAKRIFFLQKWAKKVVFVRKEQRDFLYWHILSKHRRSEKVHLSCTGWRLSRWEGWNYFEGWTFEHWPSFTGSWHAIGGGERFGVCGWSFGSRIASWAFLKASDCYIISRDAKSWGPWTVF